MLTFGSGVETFDAPASPTTGEQAGLEQPADDFAAKARAWRKAGKDSYIFMINGAKVRAPAAATALRKRIGV